MAGFLGDQPDNLDLPAILLSQEDPALLAEAIRARTLWTGLGLAEGLELWDGFACGWIPRNQVPGRSWAAKEIERLRSILARRSEPDLRDAASLALADRYRGARQDRKAAPEPIRVPGFRVHEWGVWQEGNGVLTAAGKSLDDLPAFVHRTAVSPQRISVERFYTPSVVFKPVVFFHAPAPLEVLFRVDFHEGMPWTWFPAATDLNETTGGGRSGPGNREIRWPWIGGTAGFYPAG
jgi:hypothetical protein